MKKIFIIGYLGKDAEVKISAKENNLLLFSVAVSTQFTNKDTGEVTKKTDWFSIFKNYKKSPEFVKYLTKGARVCVSGDLSFENVTRDGKDYHNVNVSADTIQVLFDSKTPEQ